MTPDAFFLPAVGPAGGQRFCVHHAAAEQAPRGTLLYLHPFAEEMNKSRRMAAMQSRALAAEGFAVLQIDLFGCGDSSGDFGDAGWSDWIDDALLGAQWLRSRYVGTPLWLWGLRAGCLLATAAAQRLDGALNFLFWHPSTAGKLVLQQFLRLKGAKDLLQGQSRGAMQNLMTQLKQGQALEIAGYRLSPALADGLALAALSAPSHAARVAWLELSAQPERELAPASQSALTSWKPVCDSLSAHVVPGPAFWQTTEIEDAPALIETTIAALCGEAAP
jgi:uncharacterized protein